VRPRTAAVHGLNPRLNVREPASDGGVISVYLVRADNPSVSGTESIEVLDFPDEDSSHYAKIRAELHRLGKMIGANDFLIAAHARSLDLTLVTNNVREFKRIAICRSRTGQSIPEAQIAYRARYARLGKGTTSVVRLRTLKRPRASAP
jgi:hypothetical protein